ncbi:hypothetical protein EV424DRAFT_173814 [Suillus variegatus]|nr:hypothetical protein EV424DRAFT_173814 [Suillus variegatus]
MSQQDLDLPDIEWPELWNTMHASSLYALTKANTSWSTRHPYVAAGALILISANPELLLTPLRLAGRFTLYIFGFRRQGVAKDSLASQYQSHLYGGYVPRDSTFARFQSYGAADNYDADLKQDRYLGLVSPGCQVLELCLSWAGGGGGGIDVVAGHRVC